MRPGRSMETILVESIPITVGKEDDGRWKSSSRRRLDSPPIRLMSQAVLLLEILKPIPVEISKKP
jgi:hypothetical protein